ncbi:MAG: hypothetical protein CMI54_05830 [Parcubacteria group bacterium]|nr:hypothetical protein [Parcubacteria group bacterium]
MPLPSPDKGQKEKGFINSCMSSETMKKEFPDRKQRLAVCYSQQKKRKKAKGAEVDALDWREMENEPFIIY